MCVPSLRNFIYYSVLEIDTPSAFRSLLDITNAPLPQFLFVFAYVFFSLFVVNNLIS